MSHLNIIQWNIKGYFNNLIDLQLILKEHTADLVSLQETHCKSNNVPKPPKNYYNYFKNNPSNLTAKSGIGLLIRKNIPHRVLNNTSKLLNISVEIILSTKITIISVYIPPNETFSLQDINDLFKDIQTPIILLGDVNSWNVMWGSHSNNPRGNIIESSLNQNNLCIINDGKPTHLSTHNTFTNVDITACSPSLLSTTTCKTLDDLHNSDHFPIKTTLTINSNFPNKINIRKFNLKKANWKDYSEMIDKSLKSVQLSGNVNKDNAILTKAIRTAANFYIPQTSPTQSHFIPWWNTTLSQLRYDKMDKWHKFKKHPLIANLISYKKANAKFRLESKKAKALYFENFSKTINRDSPLSLLWKKINIISSHKTYNPISIIKTNSQIITDPKEIANYFAKQWSDYSSDNNFTPDFISAKNNSLRHIIHEAKTFNAKTIDSPITLIELKTTLKKAKGATPGRDRISYHLIKHLNENSISLLLKLYNEIFSLGIIPHTWKTAVIAAIPKPNKDITQFSGYRPISLLPCLSKILESIIAKRLKWFIERNKLVAVNQLAFKTNKGCTDVLLHLDHFITKTLSARNHTSILAIDFEKAFDRIGIHIILDTLKEWAIGPKIFNFVKAFLSGRSIQVSINHHLSNKLPLLNGIPQGSPLSVILFQISFNKISTIIKQHKYLDHCLYADDLYILCKNNHNSNINEKLLSAITSITAWSKVSGAKISLDKSTLLHICRKHKCQPTSIDINDTTIPLVSKQKILGIIFEKNYRWKEQILQLKKSITPRANFLRYLASRSFVHTNTLTYLIKTLILSKIEYGLFLFGNSSKSNLNIIKTIYHQTIRASLYAFRTTPIQVMLIEAGLPSLEEKTSESLNRLLPKILQFNASIIDNDVSSILSSSKTPKVHSALFKIINENLVNFREKLSTFPTKYPWWLLDKNTCNMALKTLKKHCTPNEAYHQMYNNLTSTIGGPDWQHLFTDASKYKDRLAYAVVDQLGNTISTKQLSDICSIFTAEAAGIIQAIYAAINSKKKSIIFSDSLSVLCAVNNPNNTKWQSVNKIRDLLINGRNNIKIAWIPGHVGIKGNNFADQAAKLACSAPILKDPIIEMYDLRKLIVNSLHTQRKNKLKDYHHHHYSQINPQYTPPIYPTTISKYSIKIFSRLRMGHTISTHAHILDKNMNNICTFCGSTNSVKHIISTCPNLKQHQEKYLANNGLNLLAHPTINNIHLIHNFITKLKIKI